MAVLIVVEHWGLLPLLLSPLSFLLCVAVVVYRCIDDGVW